MSLNARYAVHEALSETVHIDIHANIQVLLLAEDAVIVDDGRAQSYWTGNFNIDEG